MDAMCPVCDSSAFRSVTWTTAAGAAWPALECVSCGAITREKHLSPRGSEPTTEERPTFRPPHLSGTYPLVRTSDRPETFKALLELLNHG